jgi:hypothetical protein
MLPGDVYQYLGTYSEYELQFNGRAAYESDTLTYELISDPISFRNCSNTSQTITIPSALRIRSNQPNPFTYGSYSGNDLYYQTNGAGMGRVFIKSTSGITCYYQAEYGGTGARSIAYSVAGDAQDSVDGGLILVQPAIGINSLLISLFEDMGQVGTDASRAARLLLLARNTTNYSADGTYRFLPSAGGMEYVEYTSGANSTPQNQNGDHAEGWVSERGTRFVSIDSMSAQFDVAASVGRLNFNLEAQAPPQQLPDLRISAATLPTSMVTGQRYPSTATTRNEGPGASAPSTTLVKYGNRVLGQIAVPSLNAGQEHIGSFTASCTGTENTQSLTITADQGAANAETNENNNVNMNTIPCRIGPLPTNRTRIVPSTISPGPAQRTTAVLNSLGLGVDMDKLLGQLGSVFGQ